MGLLDFRQKDNMAPLAIHVAEKPKPLELDNLPDSIRAPTVVEPAAAPPVTQPVKPQAGGVAVDVKKRLGQLARKAKSAKRKLVQDLLELGGVIVEARELLADHHRGGFGRWCKQIGMSRMSAHNYAAISDAFGSCKKNVQLTFDSQSVRLLAKSTQPAIDEAIELAESGEHVDGQVAKALITKHAIVKDKPKRIEPVVISTEFGSVALRPKPGASVRDLAAAVLSQLMDASKKKAA